MDLFVLDGLYRRTEVVDSYESLIWSERSSGHGDLIVHMHSNNESLNLLKEGTWCAIEDSHRTMVIDTVMDKETEDGLAMVEVKGRSLEKFMMDRIALAKIGAALQYKWILEGTPDEIIKKIVNDIMILGLIDPADVLPMLSIGSPPGLFPADTIALSSDIIKLEMEPKTVYQAVKDLSDVYNQGFRIVREPNEPYLYFDTFAGSDRTSSQSDLPAVLFSPSLDNMQNTTELTSLAEFKNVALVMSNMGHRMVYPDSNVPTGLDRHVLYVNAGDFEEGTTQAEADLLMDLLGRSELTKHQRVEVFDGEMSQTSQYRYGVDYNLGDLVEMRNKSGVANYMRVTEQIFASDKEGVRAYPTLSLNRFVRPGTWLAWDYNQVWLDLDNDPMTWADQP